MKALPSGRHGPFVTHGQRSTIFYCPIFPMTMAKNVFLVLLQQNLDQMLKTFLMRHKSCFHLLHKTFQLYEKLPEKCRAMLLLGHTAKRLKIGTSVLINYSQCPLFHD